MLDLNVSWSSTCYTKMLTSLGKRSLVVDNGNVLLGKVGNLLVLDFPKLLGDLRDKS